MSLLPRRAFHLLGLGSVLGGLGGLGGCAGLRGTAGEAPAPQRVAEGVWMLPGADGELGPANRGRVGNAGFVVGPAGVLVIDSGVSLRQGEAVLAAVAQVTRQPVRALLLTHARQEFLFGAQAFRARGIPVHMHRQAAGLMAARCERCLRTLREQLGEDEMAGTRLIVPDQRFDAPATAFEALGRPLQFLAWGHSSGPGDTAVWVPDAGVLFAGGLMDQAAVPDLQDSELGGWHRALHDLQALPLQRIIPGHGPLADVSLVARTERYLQQLEAHVAALLRAGTPLSEVAEAPGLAEFASWAHFDTTHRRNTSIVYLRQERALLSR